MDAKLETIRNTLSDQLDEACSFIVQISNAAKRIDGLRMLLYSKRDIAIDKLNHIFLTAEETLEKLKNSLEKQINEYSTDKIEFLTTERDSLKRVIRDTAMSCTQIEEVLVIGKEEQLIREGVRLADKMKKLMSVKPDELLADVNYLEFVPNPECTKQFKFTELLGYVRCMELDPKNVKLDNISTKAFIGVEENITIQTNVERSDSLKFMSVKLLDSKSNMLDMFLDSNGGSGEYKVSFTPEQTGEHNLEVTVYGKHIPGSPFHIKVVEPSSESGSQDSVTDESAFNKKKTGPRSRVRCSRLALKAMEDHIRTNPDVNQQVADAMIKEELPNPSSPSVKYGSSQKYIPPRPYYDRRGNEYDDWQYSEKNQRDRHNSGNWRNTDNNNSWKTDYNTSTSQNWRDTEKYSSPNDLEADSKYRNNSGYSQTKIKQEVCTPVKVKEKEIKVQTLNVTIKNELFKDLPSVESVKQRNNYSSPSKVPLTSPDSLKQRDDSCSNEGNKTPREGFSKPAFGKFVKREKVSEDWENEATEPTVISDVKLHSSKQSPENKSFSSKGLTPKWQQKTDDEKLQNKKHDDYLKHDLYTTKQGNMTSNFNNKEDKGRFWANSSGGWEESHDSSYRGNGTSSRTNSSRKQLIPEPDYNTSKTESALKPVHETSSLTSGTAKKPLLGLLPTPVVNKDENNNTNFNNNTVATAAASKKVSDARNVESCNISTDVIQKNIKHGSPVINASYVRTVGHQGSDSSSTNFPIGVTASLDDHVIVCDNGQNCVRVFTWGGQLKSTLGQSDSLKFRRPSAVVTNQQGDIFVKDDFAVHVFNRMGTYLRKFGDKVLKKPFGLAMDTDGLLLMINYNWDEVTLVIYDQLGNLIEKTPFKPITKTLVRASKLRFLATHGHKLAVSDLGINKVFVTDMRCNPLYEFGTRGDLPGMFIEPSGVKFDGCGNLVVADSKNDRIQVFKEDGTFLSRVEVGRIRRPSDIWLTADGHLIVANLLGHYAKIFKIEAPRGLQIQSN